MKAFVLVALAVATALPAFGQIYSARRLTRNVAPQPQQPQRPPAQPQYAAPQATAPAKPATPAEAAKAQAEKNKNEAKQLDFYKRRAEEGSDHAQYELAMRYLTGKGTPPNEKLAREWLAKSAKSGNAQAAKQLADLGPEKAVAKTLPAEAKEAK